MIKDNVHFKTSESGFDQIELVGTYELGTSLLISEVEWRQNRAQIEPEAKQLITENLRRVITADMLDIPFLKLLYKNDALLYLVVDTLDRRAYDMRMNMIPGVLGKERYEELKMLELLIYDLRTFKETE